MSEFGFESTTEDILGDMDLSGRRVLVTGGASGLGLETARAMAARGASVVIAARDMEKGAAATDSIVADTPTADVEVMQLDLADLDSIRAFATLFVRDYEVLDLLINNAGVMACPKGETVDGFEMQFGTNHLGHFLLTSRLMPALKAAANEGREPRVVTLSSRAHHRGEVDLDDPNYADQSYDKWQAYGRSKSANALFALELHRRYSDIGLQSYSVHPGGIVTNLGRHLDEDDVRRLMEMMAAAAKSDKPGGLKTIPQGAATTCFAATADLSGHGGAYLENCGVAYANNDEADASGGAKPWIRDAATAEKLWTLSEELVGEAFGSV